MHHVSTLRSLAVSASLVCLLAGCKRGRDGESSAAERAAGEEQPAQQVVCGKATCGAGEVCCNPSCGICTAADGMCTQQFCDEQPAVDQAGEPPPPPAALTACDGVRCESGEHCELVQVQCVRAPCDPVPQCRPDAQADGGTRADGGRTRR